MDARLEVGLEQQAELMLKMMATLHADSILQALTSSSSTGNGDSPPAVHPRPDQRCAAALIPLSDFQPPRPQTAPTTAC